jgi:hypothetical protein
VFDASVMDKQLGAVGILYTLFALDPSLRLPLETKAAPAAPPAPTQPRPAPSAPAKPPTPPAVNPGGGKAAQGVGASLIAAGLALAQQALAQGAGKAKLAQLTAFTAQHAA